MSRSKSRRQGARGDLNKAEMTRWGGGSVCGGVETKRAMAYL